MAWITPKTDWSELDRCGYTDMNRIAGNINELAGTSLKANYTQDDIVTGFQWTAIITAVIALAETEGYHIDDAPDMSATAGNINTVEGITQGIYDWIELKARQEVAALYMGEPYSGENYVR